MTAKNSLKGFVYANYGDFTSMANQLGVDVSTASNWSKSNPRNMLRYIPEIMKTSGVGADQIVEVVLQREHELDRAA